MQSKIDQQITAIVSRLHPTKTKVYEDVGENIYFADVNTGTEEVLEGGIFKYAADIYYKQFTKKVEADDEKPSYSKDVAGGVYKAGEQVTLLSATKIASPQLPPEESPTEGEGKGTAKRVIPCVHRGDYFEVFPVDFIPYDTALVTNKFGQSLEISVDEDTGTTAAQILGFFEGLSYDGHLIDYLKAEVTKSKATGKILGEKADKIKLLVRIDDGEGKRPRVAYLPIHKIAGDETEDPEEEECDNTFPGSDVGGGGGSDGESGDEESPLFPDQGLPPSDSGDSIDKFPGKGYSCW